ncbi:MAG TPA: N-acetyl-gamma-glutamyl-phosphate reductase, partial [Sphaerochaeta sp.]|nr:N-acetyl-gamma-glutamyl-phosphate reductase [Sphaerochaeta sp.]
MIRCGVIGATGYAGSILVTLLVGHPEVEPVYLASHSYVGKRYSDIYPSMAGHCDLILREEDLEEASTLCDVLFLALPHTLASQKVTQKILDRTVVIDLGADYRLHDVDVY